ncbi:MAG: hypothetical protein ABIQ39_05890 [Ilumatobacteraceae bacterium]
MTDLVTDVYGRPVSAGDRVRVCFMPNDPDPLPHGAIGQVTYCQTQGHPSLHQMWMSWEGEHASRTLMLLPNVDTFELLPTVQCNRCGMRDHDLSVCTREA